jgi:hypothetical protein
MNITVGVVSDLTKQSPFNVSSEYQPTALNCVEGAIYKVIWFVVKNLDS